MPEREPLVSGAICPDCAEPVELCQAKAQYPPSCWRWNDAEQRPIAPVVVNPEAIGDPDQEPEVYLWPIL